MEIEVGEYVRTISGNIDKVDTLYGVIENTIHLENHKWQSIKNIVKHSKNIIDLIEEGDYVNGKKVIKTNCNLKYVDDDDDYGDSEVNNALDLGNEYIYFNFEIKTIITKEQIKQIEYRIKE